MQPHPDVRQANYASSKARATREKPAAVQFSDLRRRHRRAISSKPGQWGGGGRTSLSFGAPLPAIVAADI